ncbi:MAG TPA: M48 family metalloprotease [Candidatus Nanoarchaeia archaeon]|nr:M48 family metalloprotease [Candidatus Nanoarchaeia archaeon]
MVIGYFAAGIVGLTVAFILALIFNFLIYWFSSSIVLFMYQAKEADQDAYAKLHNLVREVSSRAALVKPKVYIIESDAANAFATGRDPKHAAIAFTSGILKLLDEEELKGVISHELSHIKNKDVLIATIAAVIAGAISYIAMLARFSALFGRSDDKNMNIAELILLGILAPIIALIIQLAISRSREFLADETGSKILRNSQGLASALAKLNYESKNKPLKTNTATASLFIVNPLNGKGIMNLFSTHPSIQERVGRLRAMKY